MTTTNKWKRKADALARLAEDQRGKPEGDLARQKLQEIIANHPEAREYQPVKDLFARDLELEDVGAMHRMGISTEGSWGGGTLAEALAAMSRDYKARIAGYQGRPRIEGAAKQLPEGGESV